ncbi:site-2 protease family protein [Thauera mechernichensis]|uniref:Site-2 protease family protein n=1 Tax=Thauera mechernichensis TaxID=82788 RepID=A0ABW3WJ08_9RHOO|nr:site-2 protease family protein [Thauera mechernichensis]MDG3064655.1 peptidase M50 [Thauera mechernichensis]
MARSLFSSSWHSVADLRPRLIPLARVERHVYRDKVWYVVQDQSGGRYHRLTPAAYRLVQGMDGKQTVQALWEHANLSGHGDECTQNEVVDLLVQLHSADLLLVDTNSDSAALFARYRKKRRATLKQYLLNPMSLKFPLVDPDAFLQRIVPFTGWWFSTLGAVIWMLVVVPALVLAVMHWSDLTHNFSDQILSSSNLLVMFCVYPVVKLLHELGHGIAARKWGAPVHEMGLMFLVFAPVPYVNASATAIFPSRVQRSVVAAAGMLVEVFVAAIALYVWLLIEPGVSRAVAYNVIVVAGVSTLIVNGNPLLRFDAYYIFTDLIEMPNLAQRGQKYYTYLWDRHICGAHDADQPVETPAEKRWLLAYTPLAWCYRMFLTVTIVMFVSSAFFIFGVLLAIWVCITAFGMPLWKSYRHVVNSASLQRVRRRALRVSLAIVLVVLSLLFIVPAPLRTQAEGVVWLPERAIVRAGGDGFFRSWLDTPGGGVEAGQALFVLEDIGLSAEIELARARLHEAESRLRAEQFSDPVKAVLLERQRRMEAELLARLEERASLLVAHAGASGRLIVPRAQDLAGAFLRKGDLVGYVLDRDDLIARVVVRQDDIDLVRERMRAAELRFADWIGRAHVTQVVRPAAGGVDTLPSPALGIHGGGSVPTAVDDPEGLRTLERVFLIDMALPARDEAIGFGERVFVRFDLGWEPIGVQGLRRLRQLFLSKFGV